MNNRRSFFATLLAGCVAPMFLPSSLTYGRSWKGLPVGKAGDYLAPGFYVKEGAVWVPYNQWRAAWEEILYIPKEAEKRRAVFSIDKMVITKCPTVNDITYQPRV